MSLSVIADYCGIGGFILSVIAIFGVVKINKKVNNTNNVNKQVARGDDNRQSINTK
jgi:hypothetical protein